MEPGGTVERTEDEIAEDMVRSEPWKEPCGDEHVEPSYETAIVNGVLYDTVTGEALSVEGKPQFVVEDADSLLWLMEKCQRLDAQAKAVESTLEVVAARALLASEEVQRAQAIVRNVEAMKQEWAGRRDSLIKWQEKPIIRTVQNLLGMAKTKTYKTIFGSASWRITNTKAKVRDDVEMKIVHHMPNSGIGLVPPPLLKWAAENCREAIKITAEFQINSVPPDIELPEEFFTKPSSGEALKIQTGVE